MNENIVEIFTAFKEDIQILNDNFEEIKINMDKIIDSHNNLVIGHNNLHDNLDNQKRGLQLNDARLGKMELVITKIQAALPKIRSFDYLPIPKVVSGENL